MLAFVLCGLALAPGVRLRAQQEPTQPQAVSAAELRSGDRLARQARLRHADEGVADDSPLAGRAGGAGPHAGRVRPPRRIRAVPRARAADRLQRSARSRCHARRADEPERSAAQPSPTASSSTIPIATLVPNLLSAMDKESGEFVRPSLVRALAAQASVPGDEGARVRAVLVREAGRGQDFFRTAVIEALGDFKAKYAYDTLAAIATLDGPLQNDTAIALGKIGDPSRAERAGHPPANRARGIAALRGRGDLPARRQLRDAREVSRRDAEVRRAPRPASSRICARRRRAWPRVAVAGHGRSPPEALLHRRHSFQGSDPCSGVAGARHDRAAPYAAA